MTSCQAFSHHLFAFVQGDLASDEAESVRTHAESCEPCARLLVQERTLVAALRAPPAVPAFDVPEPVLPLAPVFDLPGGAGSGAPAGAHAHAPASVRWWANARLGAAVALVSAAGVLWTVQLSGVLEPLGTPEPGESSARRAVPVEITTVLTSDRSLPQADDYFLALTAGVEAVVMRRPAEDRCANGLCASGR